jgi:hemerythrin-like metal-binding protein
VVQVEQSSGLADDRVFRAFAIGLCGSVAVLIGFAYYTTGLEVPTPLVIAEHLAMSLALRAAYKSYDGRGFIHHFTLGLVGESGEESGAQAPLLEWNERLRLGVPSIDDQHRTLVLRANAVAEAVATSGVDARAQGLFGDFLSSLEAHSRFEQALFEEHDLPGGLEHGGEHESLIGQAREFFASLSSSEAARRQVTPFLRDWLSDHVVKGDKALAEQLKSRGID